MNKLLRAVQLPIALLWVSILVLGIIAIGISMRFKKGVT